MLVYKYRGSKNEDDFERDLKAVEKNYFRASSLEDLNDPCEAITNLVRLKKVYKCFGYLFGARSKKDFQFLKENLEEVLSFDKKMGIYSLSQTNLNELLWAHYGNSHKGFCIEYDLNILLESDGPKNIFSFPITYKKIPPSIGFREIVNSKNNGLIKKLGFFKSKEWEYEKEYRIITNNHGYHSYDYKALKSIYFGLNMSELHKTEIMNRLKGRGVNYFQIKQLENTYNFTVIAINDINKTEITYLNQLPFFVTNGKIVKYKIIKSKRYNYASLGEFEVEVENKIKRNELEWLANHLKQNLFAQAKRCFLNYYISPFSKDSLPWASTNYSEGKFNIQLNE